MNMTSDINLLGIYVPPLIVVALLALVLLFVLRRALASAGFYRLVVHPDMVDVALYFILAALLCFLFGGPTLTPLFR